MSSFYRLRDQFLPHIIVTILLVLICDGLVSTFFFIQPFWIDEWRVIYNLKTRSIDALWQRLDFLQQFPRTYLSVVKVFTQAFDYGYASLRLPSLFAGCTLIYLSWRIMRRMYPGKDWLQYLFPIIIASSVPFTKYFVQTKQYTMDMLLAVLAIWQFLELFRQIHARPLTLRRYFVLCVSLFVAPFFSYTYSIAIIPLFFIPLLARLHGTMREVLSKALLPIVISVAAIVSVYLVDVRQLLSDTGMHSFWKHNFIDGLEGLSILHNLFETLGHAGSGYFFELLFGLLGAIGLLRAMLLIPVDFRGGADNNAVVARWYAVMLLLTVFALFLAGKIPLGESRLNAFLIPSIAILVIDLLRSLIDSYSIAGKVAAGLATVLYLGVGGNVFTTIIGKYNDPLFQQRRVIYFTVAQAIKEAKTRQLPILAAPGIAYPYNTDPNLPDTSHTVPGDWVLITHPAYHISDHLPVYAIDSVKDARIWLDTAKVRYAGAIVCNGNSYSILASVR